MEDKTIFFIYSYTANTDNILFKLAFYGRIIENQRCRNTSLATVGKTHYSTNRIVGQCWSGAISQV